MGVSRSPGRSTSRRRPSTGSSGTRKYAPVTLLPWQSATTILLKREVWFASIPTTTGNVAPTNSPCP
uniref:Uncharacterized protein n=1 Tax=Steinernema glaseri TaxID=37863 RepID=A0A1I8AVX8_9BILA